MIHAPVRPQRVPSVAVHLPTDPRVDCLQRRWALVAARWRGCCRWQSPGAIVRHVLRRRSTPLGTGCCPRAIHRHRCRWPRRGASVTAPQCCRPRGSVDCQFPCTARQCERPSDPWCFGQCCTHHRGSDCQTLHACRTLDLDERGGLRGAKSPAPPCHLQ